MEAQKSEMFPNAERVVYEHQLPHHDLNELVQPEMLKNNKYVSNSRLQRQGILPGGMDGKNVDAVEGHPAIAKDVRAQRGLVKANAGKHDYFTVITKMSTRYIYMYT